jgi:hypothetical protein
MLSSSSSAGVCFAASVVGILVGALGPAEYRPVLYSSIGIGIASGSALLHELWQLYHRQQLQ